MSAKINTTFITTVDHNVGDDFVREGLKYLLRRFYSNRQVVFENIHKHAPITSRYGFEHKRNQKKSSRLDRRLPLWLTKDRILQADLVVQSGAPVYWCHDSVNSHCWQNEWFTPLIRRRLTKNKNAKLLNLAAGSCQKFFSNGTEFCPACNDYIKEFYDLSAVTTLRDKVATTIFDTINLNAPLIPCSSIFAPEEYNLKSDDADYVAVNYMPMAAHYDFGQNINTEKWKRDFTSFYEQLQKNERVVFVCHDQIEKEAALSVDPNAEIFFEKDDFVAYMKFYSRAKYGVMNRVHGAFMIAAFGRPSFVIGNDTRARMVEEIGLENAFVHEVSAELLLQKASELAVENNFRDRFAAIKEKAFADYTIAFAPLNS